MSPVIPPVQLSVATVSPALESLFPGFDHGICHVAHATGTIDIPFTRAGSGPALLLLHGHPQTRAIWSRIAGPLAERFSVVATDLRGYGDAGKPTPIAQAPAHAAASKRLMALDQIATMRALGHERFVVVGHDRGARVAHRLALDHPQNVLKLMVLDILPTLDMLEQTTAAFATAYWHWFFLVQPAPLPETFINADPRFWLEQLMGGRSAGLAPFLAQAWSEYVRCASNPSTIHAMCEDYRAAATIDLELDRADRAAGLRVGCPVQTLWGADGVVARLFEPLAAWRAATDPVQAVNGGALSCGHYLPEEASDELLAQILAFT